MLQEDVGVPVCGTETQPSPLSSSCHPLAPFATPCATFAVPTCMQGPRMVLTGLRHAAVRLACHTRHARPAFPTAFAGRGFASLASRSVAPARPAALPSLVKGLRAVVRRWQTTAAAAAGGAAASPAAAAPAGPSRAVGWWMAGCCGMVFGSISLGGVTRLTESGLSMVDWHILKGMKPPTSQAEWVDEFEKYKQYPEYKYITGKFELSDFKRIFYMEYWHRMWGRLVGLAYVVPAAFFWQRGMIQPQYKPAVVSLGLLVGLQGLIGWYMVKSGLDHDPQGKHMPRVSQYRLALHLGGAFALYSGSLWLSLTHLLPYKLTVLQLNIQNLRILSRGLTGLVFTTAMSGAFVAGLDAGLIYNSFPKMGAYWIPEDLWTLEPALRNFTENGTMTQFNHRILGTTTLAVTFATWLLSRGKALHPRARLAANAAIAMACTQVTLGISTLLWLVPVPLAAVHQAGSLTLLSFAIWFMHEIRRIPRF